MVFSSSVFLFIFLPALLFVYFVSDKIFHNIKLNNIILLLASMFFYAWGEPVFIFVMVFFVFLNYIAGLLIDRYKERQKMKMAVATLMTICNVLLLVTFKYIPFILGNVKKISGLDFAIPDIALPIGISFFTFQMMSYIFDIASGKAKVQKSFFDLLLYISMFPQLIAGPIVRYETIQNQLAKRVVTFDSFAQGRVRFIKGLAKKILLANNIALLADTVFSYESVDLTLWTSWLGVIAYTLQIYFDFSGYSDMAIGLGRMFGFEFLENFDSPYKAKSITEFWRKWHISMGSWFRDYVYFPMGGSRVPTKMRAFFNIFVVWLLTGLWHGANWTFVLWGMLHGMVLIAEKTLKLNKVSSASFFARFFLHLWTLFFVMLGWALFRSPDVSSAFCYVKSMFDFPSLQHIDENFVGLLRQFWVFILVGSVICLCNIQKMTKILPKKLYDVLSILVYLFLLALCVCGVAKSGYDPFIYFNF